MKNAVLFLPGRYPATQIEFYQKLCRGKYKVAVDAGYRFFSRANIAPDLLLGDFDSLRGVPTNLTSKTKIVRFSTDKDKSDLELALDYCLEAGAPSIDIVQLTVGEPDHYVANLLILTRGGQTKGRRGPDIQIRLVNHRYEVICVQNSSREYRNRQRDTLSIVPISPSIVLTTKGTAYDISAKRIGRGGTESTRNRISAARARVTIKGEALVFLLYNR